MPPPSWTVHFYQDSNGRFPARDWIAGLDAKARARIERTIGLLQAQGTLLGDPHSRHVRGKIWELRVPFRGMAYRVLYFAAMGHEFVVLHAFAKKTDKAPARELAIAKRV
jgi:phage-related protein